MPPTAAPVAAIPAPTTPVPAAVPPSAPAQTEPVNLGQPVEQAKLGDINPQSIGLLSNTEGGLGAGMWKGTPRDMVEQILAQLNLPSFSFTLNNLAQRFLLTTADVPEGKASASLTALRVDALDDLGDDKNAWKLIALAPQDEIDDATLMRVASHLLTSAAAPDVCAKLPDIIKTRTKTDWQELLVVCQLQAKDMKAVQITLDLMHSQSVRDDTFFYLVERNIIAGNKELPRQLTPLKPLTLALLQLTGLAARSELYGHPDAALIPPLLTLKTHDDNMRLSLAERAGERGSITAAELEAVYVGIAFPPQAVAGAATTNESLVPRLHALVYQAAQQEKDPDKRIALAAKFLNNSTAGELNGVQARVIADILGTVAPSDAYNSVAAQVAHIYILAGNPQAALEWLKQARHAAIGMPGVTADLQSLWPVIVLAGLETDSDYGQNLGKWLDAELTKNDDRATREKIGSVLMLLDAAGYAVPEDGWARVITPPAPERHPVPPAILLNRLSAASIANHRGETVLLSLLLGGGNVEEPSFLATVGVVRALRLVGLAADSATFAREAVTSILTVPLAKS